MSDGELAEAMLSLRREQARLAAVVAEQTAAFEARQVYAEDGSRSATDWIAVHGRLPRGPVAGEVRDARRLRSMPETRAAFRAGDISAAHVRVLCRLAGHPRAGRHFPDGEAHLVGEGRRLRFDDWQRLCDYWRDAADPDGPEQRHGRDSDLRRFRIGVGLDGVGHADGYLTPVATAAVNGRWRGSNASCSPPTGPRPKPSTATPPPRPIWPAPLRSGATTPWSRWPPGP